MIQSNQKTSLLVPSQLPEYIRDDESYAKFIAFVQAYYEWLEQNNNVLDYTKNLTNYQDIDKTTSDFLDYFKNDFLSYFPEETLVDKRKLVKLSKELYKSKGTPASYQFLFRVLYNSEVEFFDTKDAILKPSSGKWYVPKSLKLSSDHPAFLNIDNLRIFGKTTKSIATVENTTVSKNKSEVFISNIERLFQSGEFINILYANNQPVYFSEEGNIVPKDTPGSFSIDTLDVKIVGQISNITVNPKYRGLSYQVGDPVIVYGGLTSNTGIGASAYVSEVTKGSIQSISVDNSGYGYTPNTKIYFKGLNPGSQAPIAHIANFDAANTYPIALIPSDRIGSKTAGASYTGLNLGVFANATHYISNTGVQYYFANNLYANATTQLANAFTLYTLNTAPISSVIVDNQGGGITVTPIVSANSIFKPQDSEPSDSIDWADLKNLGILAPLQIINGGEGYQPNDVISITSGTGYGAYANVTNVDTFGTITEVSFVYPPADIPHHYPLGGLGYTATSLPTISVVSANVLAANAIISAPGILGDGATFTPTLDRVGSVTKIGITEYGEDYISAPDVSLKVQDIYVKGLYRSNLPLSYDKIYQGVDANNKTYQATVESVIRIGDFNADEPQNIYRVRVYNYDKKPSYVVNTLKIENKDITMSMTNEYNNIILLLDNRYDSANGVLTYGTLTARATSKFLNGLVIGEGQYLDSTGHPSGFDILQSENYNNYTYILTLEKEIAKYRDALLGLLHPTGTKVIGRFAMNSNSMVELSQSDELANGKSLLYYTGYAGSNASMSVNFTTGGVSQSSNTIQFNNLASANLGDIIFSNSVIELLSGYGPNVISTITSIDYVANTVTISDNVWLTFANVATIIGNSSSNVINIRTITNSYDIINNGNYSNTLYPIKDIIRVGDKISVPNNTVKTVTVVDYLNNRIYIDSNLSSNSSGYLTVNKTLFAPASTVKIWNTVGYQFIPELITQDGFTITTQDYRKLILG